MSSNSGSSEISDPYGSEFTTPRKTKIEQQKNLKTFTEKDRVIDEIVEVLEMSQKAHKMGLMHPNLHSQSEAQET
jgi:hypothetical protein